MAAMPGSAAPRIPPWRVKLARFWRWWSGELRAMVPERFATMAGAARVPLVQFDVAGLALIEPPAAEGSLERVDVSALEGAAAAAAARAMLARAGESRGRARLALSVGEALVRRVTMPAATEENLGSVLGFEMDRLTPFRSDEVYYDHRVIGRDSAAGTVTVLLAVARREVVEARLARAQALGLSVQAVEVRELSPRGGPALDVLPSSQRGEREKPKERLVRLTLVAAAALLLLTALAVPLLQKRAEVHAIKPVLDQANSQAQATDALLRELERQVADYNFLLTRKHNAYPTLAYLEEVTRLLPDNTWLQQLDLKAAGKGRELLISGETVASSTLIEILEQSRLLQNAAPRGAVTRGMQPGTERFVISAEVRPKPQPEAIPVTQAQAAVTPTPAFAPPQAQPQAPPVANVTVVPPAAAAASPPAAATPPPAAGQPTQAPKMDPSNKLGGKGNTPPPPEPPKAPGK